MADIKTRQVSRGTIRTLDRASVMTSHIKEARARTKEETHRFHGQEGQQVSSQASDQMERGTRQSAEKTVLYGNEIVKTAWYFSRENASDVSAEKITTRPKQRPRRRNSSHKARRQTVSERPAGTVSRRGGGRAGQAKSLEKQRSRLKHQYQIGKRAQKGARASGRAAVRAARSIRAALESTKLFTISISVGGGVVIMIILVIMLFSAAFYTFGDDSSANYIEVSPEVEAYTPVISEYAQIYGIGEYVELIKAVMMQESGGRGTDPMQCSESSYNRKYPHAPGSIRDPEYSIQCGVQYLANCLKQAKSKSPLDMPHIRLALQGYNYGNGYIPWAIKRDGGYTVENADVFSDQQAKKHGWSGYGDKQYPAHVLRYYPYGSYNIGVGNTAIVKVAQQQIGNHGGRKYWSWYGFSCRVDWCAIFVSWCSNQCGYTKSGTIPKFSVVSSGANWFKSNHQWQGRNYTPAAGDIIFISWSGSGAMDHTGIVERCDGRIVHTIEGNRSDQVMRGTYSVGSRLITGYGIPRY